MAGKFFDIELQLIIRYVPDKSNELANADHRSRLSTFRQDLTALDFVHPPSQSIKWTPPNTMAGTWKTTKNGVLFRSTTERVTQIHRKPPQSNISSVLAKHSIENCFYKYWHVGEQVQESPSSVGQYVNRPTPPPFKRRRSRSRSSDITFPPPKKFVPSEAGDPSESTAILPTKLESREDSDTATFGDLASATYQGTTPVRIQRRRISSAAKDSQDAPPKQDIDSFDSDVPRRTTRSGRPLAAPTSRTSILTQELWDVRRQLSTGRARETAIMQELRALGVADAELQSSEADDVDALKHHLTAAENQLAREARRRAHVEQALADVERECRAPFIVPELLHAFMKISEITTSTGT